MWFLTEGRQPLIMSATLAMWWVAMITAIVVSGLAAVTIAPDPALATLPIALQTVTTIFVPGPMSMFMQRRGRRAGFLVGSAIGAIGGLICFWGVLHGNFYLLCLGSMPIGVLHSTSQLFRLAATDNVADVHKGRAVSVVLSGGLIGAVLGPFLATEAADWFDAKYAGSFLALAVIAVLMMIPMLFMPSKPVAAATESGRSGGRPLREIIKQPRFIAAVANSATGIAVMILLMHSAPLAMEICGYSHGQGASVISMHVVGMFLPSLILTSWLLDRLGTATTAAIGAALLVLSAIVGVSGITLAHFYGSLILLGVGWNFMYSAGTKQLTTAHTDEERGKTQGAAETFINILGTGASFSSGALIALIGWDAINIAASILVAAASVVSFLAIRADKRAAAQPAE